MLKRSLFFSTCVLAIILTSCQFFQKITYKSITCSAIDDLKGYVQPGCLIVADFDNTLFECVDQNQGSDQWFEANLKLIGDLKKVCHLYELAHNTALIKPVEPMTIPLLQMFAKSKVMVIVLTARSIIQQTFRELKNIQESPVREFSFNIFHIGANELTLNLEKNTAYYQQGIFFCGSNNKGNALLALLDQLKIKPTKVIFIDDKERNVQAVAKAVIKNNIQFIGLRYSYLDEKVKKYHLPKTVHAT